MLFSENLEEIVFGRHNVVLADELVIVSGYLGPSPVQRLSSLPFNTTVIYGMYGSEKIKKKLHEALIPLVNDRVNILYSNIPVHSKCYIWKRNGQIVHALVGSANFSTNGLCTPYREVLAETTVDTFQPLQAYVDKILANSIKCDDHIVIVDSASEPRHFVSENYDPETCEMTLLTRSNEIPEASGINWGHGNAHTTPNDAYIAIRSEYVKRYPQLFPPKQTVPSSTEHGGRLHRNNDAVEIIWDDGTTMEGLLEGNYNIDGVIYPKQVSSSPRKSIMGEYLRQRLGLESGAKVTRADLERYGRTSISVSLQSEGIYYFDFSVS